MSVVRRPRTRAAPRAPLPPRHPLTGRRGLVWLIKRETLRVSKLWTQTVLAPIVSASLFIVVFGLSLGGRIREIDGVPYKQFIVPGLIVMAMVQAAYSNNSSSVFQARSDRYINDVLSAPMRPWQVNLGFNFGGVIRALAIGIGMAAVAIPVTDVPVRHADWCSSRRRCSGWCCSASLGTIVGIFAETFDHHAFVNNIVILPLAFLGGTFYSVDSLASAVARAVALQPGLLPGQRGALRLPGHERRQRLGLPGRHRRRWRVPAYLWSQWLFTSGRKLKA